MNLYAATPVIFSISDCVRSGPWKNSPDLSWALGSSDRIDQVISRSRFMIWFPTYTDVGYTDVAFIVSICRRAPSVTAEWPKAHLSCSKENILFTSESNQGTFIEDIRIKNNLNSNTLLLELAKIEIESAFNWAPEFEKVSELQKNRLDRQIEQFKELQRVLVKI